MIALHTEHYRVKVECSSTGYIYENSNSEGLDVNFSPLLCVPQRKFL